jgi:hypothetical protein
MSCLIFVNPVGAGRGPTAKPWAGLKTTRIHVFSLRKRKPIMSLSTQALE